MNTLHFLRAMSLMLLLSPLALIGMDKTNSMPGIKTGNTLTKLSLLKNQLNHTQPNSKPFVAKANLPITQTSNNQTVVNASKSVADSLEKLVDATKEKPNVKPTITTTNVVVKKALTRDQLQAKLYRAILNDSEKEVKEAIKAGADHSMSNLKGGLGILHPSFRPALVVAVELAKSNAVKALIDCGARFDSTYLSPNQDLLHGVLEYIEYAVNLGDMKTALIILQNTHWEDSYSLKNGVGQNTKMLINALGKCFDFFEETPELCLQFIQEIINRGYDVNSSYGQYNEYQGRQMNPNLWCMILVGRPSFEGIERVINLLIKNGANPNQLMLEGTSLMLAIHHFNVKAVECLLNAGADANQLVNYANRTQLTPLAFAMKTPSQGSESDKTEVIKLLQKHGARLK
jgi:hypothetical protein